MIFWLFVLGIILVIIYFSRGKKPDQNTLEQQLDARNKQWINFIAGYGRIAKNAKERLFVQRMLDDIAQQGLGEHIVLEATKSEKHLRTPVIAAAVSELESTQTPIENENAAEQPIDISPAESSTEIALDNVSLLLYFGAFLFVAAVGLFISFGGASGELRTFAVLLVSLVLYSGGMWLFHNRPKLEQAALAFVGIGIVMAPLVGAAAYIYVFNKSHGSLVWFVTSLLCFGLYVHALITIRKPLISYLLIFTFLSVFESGVSVMTVPVYYYGWGLAATGILLQVLSYWKGYWPELREPSRQSAQLFLPIAVLASLAMYPTMGALQLGISLIFAAVFYGLETLQTIGSTREYNAIISQLSAISAVAVLAYSAHHDWKQVSVALLIASIVQAIMSVTVVREGQLSGNFGSLTLVTSIAAVLCAVLFPPTLLIALAGTIVVGALVYLKQRRGDAYALASLAVTAIPLVYGQYYLNHHLSYEQQTIIGLLTSVVLLGLYIWRFPRSHTDHEMRMYAAASFVLATTATMVTAFLASPVMCLFAAVATALLLIVLAEFDDDNDWADAAALVLILSMIRSWNDQGAFLIATLVTLGSLMVMALRYRREVMRWASTIVWLFVPIALGRWWPHRSWDDLTYAWAYLAAMAGLIFSRAIARGVVFVSARIPLTSYARSASLSYVAGYCVAASAAVGLSLASEASRLQTSVILGLLMVTTVFLARYIEKRQDILAILPLLAQGLLLSIMRPPLTGSGLDEWLVSSTILAAGCFWLADSIAQTPKYKDICYTAQTALITAFLSPAALFTTGKVTWPIAVGLLVAGSLTLYYVRNYEQTIRELAGGIIAASIMMFLYVFGVHEFQAYVHVLVLTFGLYAYWRAQIGDAAGSDGYLWAMLVTATVPLGLQALGGSGGGLYGWWLLIEQVAIMLLGMAINKSFVTRWGLFVAIGAVLYQLRNLGYLALGVLAIVLIGIAIYQLQKHEDPK